VIHEEALLIEVHVDWHPELKIVEPKPGDTAYSPERGAYIVGKD
jgi:hypothetical protein